MKLYCDKMVTQIVISYSY